MVKNRIARADQHKIKLKPIHTQSVNHHQEWFSVTFSNTLKMKQLGINMHNIYKEPKSRN